MQHIDLTPQITERLCSELNMTPRGEHLRGGECPGCGKKTVWTWIAKPGRVQCDRTNSCNWNATSKDLFPDLFEKINERYKPTTKNPNATAQAYLSIMRGINPDLIKGWFEQNKYWHPNGNKGTSTARFYLNADKTVFWERLIDDVTITDEDGSQEVRNKNFKGKFKGLWWQPPGFSINDGDEIYWCEGILDAISLTLNGLKAVAIMSSGTFPTEAIKPHLGKKVTWVLALDNDETGRRCLLKHAKRLRDMNQRVSAMLSSDTEEKDDWNDLHKKGRLTAKDIQHYRYLGRLELAQSHREKAQNIWQNNTSKSFFCFDYGNRTYSAKVDKGEVEKAAILFWAGDAGVNPESLTSEQLKELEQKASSAKNDKANEYVFVRGAKIKEIASFKMDFLYFQQPDNGEDGQYFFRFKFANNAPEQQLPFTGKTFGSAGDFKKAAMHKAAGAQFTGNTNELDSLYRGWTTKIPKIVRTLDFIGYDKASSTYVFNDFAVENGRVLKLNKESFFQLKKSGVKTLVDIRQTLSEKHNDAWLADFQTAFGIKGMVTLAWWFGSLFAEQVRRDYKSYPFFELIGEAGSGKTDMVDFLWKLLGKEGESFNPNSSTLPGRMRKMAEVSNLPVVFNETDNEQSAEEKHQRRFNWNEQKDLFDGELSRVTGVKTQDNSTKKPKFKATLMIVQNIPVQASEAILTRICHLNFDRSHHSLAGKHASDRLNMTPVDQLSGFLLNSVKQSERILKYFKIRLNHHRLALQKNEAIKLQRIVENHAKIMAFADCLQKIMPAISDDTLAQVQQQLEKMAGQRQESLNEDHPVIQQFWAQFDYLDSKQKDSYSTVLVENQLNHSRNPAQEIAVNLEHFHSACREYGVPLMDPKELRRHLASSRKRPYIKNEPINSALEHRTIRCWIFKRVGGAL